MSEATFDQEDGFIFTDEDFERRYYSPNENISTSGTGGVGGSFKPQSTANTTQATRGPNRFMRTLLRRRLAGAARLG